MPVRIGIGDCQSGDQTLTDALFVGEIDIRLLLLTPHKLLLALFGAALIALAFDEVIQSRRVHAKEARAFLRTPPLFSYVTGQSLPFKLEHRIPSMADV